MILRILKILLAYFLMVYGCTYHNEKEPSLDNLHKITDVSRFLSSDTTPLIGWPTRIKESDGDIFIIDAGSYHVVKLDMDGHLILSFGRRGRGPGEFESLTGFWIFDDSLMVYDYNSFKFVTYDHQGNLIDEKIVEVNPVNPGFPPNIPITVHAISNRELLIPSRGRNGSLFAITNIYTGSLHYVGEAIGEHIDNYNNEEVIEAYSKGKIPKISINRVTLTSNQTGIYSFQQTTAILEKYSFSGELLWQKNLKIQAQIDLFNHIALNNVKIGLRDEPRDLFMYAKAMEASENGVAVLLNLPNGEPVTIVWVSDDGSGLDVVTIESIEQSELGMWPSFTLSSSVGKIWMLNTEEGIIYESEWPL